MMGVVGVCLRLSLSICGRLMVFVQRVIRNKYALNYGLRNLVYFGFCVRLWRRRVNKFGRELTVSLWNGDVWSSL